MTSKARHITSDKLNSLLFEAFDDDAPIFSNLCVHTHAAQIRSMASISTELTCQARYASAHIDVCKAFRSALRQRRTQAKAILRKVPLELPYE